MLLRTVTTSLVVLLLSVTACTDHSSFALDPAGSPPGGIDDPIDPGTGGGDPTPLDGGGNTTPPDGGAALPEPGTMLLVGSGLAGMAFYRRRKGNKYPA